MPLKMKHGQGVIPADFASSIILFPAYWVVGWFVPDNWMAG